jgi:hypothetical protein
MSEVKKIDEVRGAVLDRIERSERHYKAAFFGAALVEASFLAGFLILADLSNRTHILFINHHGRHLQAARARPDGARQLHQSKHAPRLQGRRVARPQDKAVTSDE